MFSCIHTAVDLVLYCSAAHKVSYFNAKEKKQLKYTSRPFKVGDMSDAWCSFSIQC